MRTNLDGFKKIRLNFRSKFVTVRMRGLPENVEELLESKFRDGVKLNYGKTGCSFRVKSRTQYEDLCRWLEIPSLKGKVL